MLLQTGEGIAILLAGELMLGEEDPPQLDGKLTIQLGEAALTQLARVLLLQPGKVLPQLREEILQHLTREVLLLVGE